MTSPPLTQDRGPHIAVSPKDTLKIPPSSSVSPDPGILGRPPTVRLGSQMVTRRSHKNARAYYAKDVTPHSLCAGRAAFLIKIRVRGV